MAGPDLGDGGRQVDPQVVAGREEQRHSHDLTNPAGDEPPQRLADRGRREIQVGHGDGAAGQLAAYGVGELVHDQLRAGVAAPVRNQQHRPPPEVVSARRQHLPSWR